MNKVRKGLRLLLIVLLLILAAFGVGITGNFLQGNREKYMDNQIKREQLEKRDDEDEEQAKD